MTVQRVAAVLADDVGVRLEDRDDLLWGWNGFAFEDAASGLVEHLVRKSDEVLELGAKLKLGLLECFGWIVFLEFLDGGSRRSDRVLSDLSRTLRRIGASFRVDVKHPQDSGTPMLYFRNPRRRIRVSARAVTRFGTETS